MRFRELPVGPSRHLVRFLVSDGGRYALKEQPLDVGSTEFEVLRHLETHGPAGGRGGRPRGARRSATPRSS